MTDSFKGGDPNSDAVTVTHDPVSGTSNNVALFVQRLARLGTGIALRVFTAGPGPSARFEGGSVEIAAAPGTATLSYPYGQTGAVPTGIDVQSSYAGGDDNGSGTDSTGRINLYSYQRANVKSLGETIRNFLMRYDSKAMTAWYGPQSGTAANFNAGGDPASGSSWKPWVWTGAHYEANDHGSVHGHYEIEVPDSTGALQGRLEVPFVDQENAPGTIGVDMTNIRTNMADFSVRAQATGGTLRVGGANSRNKDIALSIDSGRAAAYQRWILRANTTTESGSNVGTDFEIRRHTDLGAYIDSPLAITRSTGNVTVANNLYVSGTLSTGTPQASANNAVAFAVAPEIPLSAMSAVNGVVYLSAVYVPKATNVTKVFWSLSTVATTPVATQNEVGLYDSSGTRLASVNVDSATSATIGGKTATIASTAVVPGTYYVAMVFNAATPPQFGRASTSSSTANIGISTASQLRFATNGTGATALPSTLTLSSNVATVAVFAGIG